MSRLHTDKECKVKLEGLNTLLDRLYTTAEVVRSFELIHGIESAKIMVNELIRELDEIELERKVKDYAHTHTGLE